MEDREALLAHYARMREELTAAIHGLTDDLMLDPSLDGWSVRDHLAHLALWDDIRAGEIARISAGHKSAWLMVGDQDEAYNQLAHALCQGMSVAQVRWELDASTQRLMDAIKAATPSGLDPTKYGEAPLRSSHFSEHAEWIRRWRAERGL